jgi:hypothetical protein
LLFKQQQQENIIIIQKHIQNFNSWEIRAWWSRGIGRWWSQPTKYQFRSR